MIINLAAVQTKVFTKSCIFGTKFCFLKKFFYEIFMYFQLNIVAIDIINIIEINQSFDID